MATERVLCRCGECGGNVVLLASPGRKREYQRGMWLAIPDDFATPVCEQCGAEYMSLEISEVLDALLRK